MSNPFIESHLKAIDRKNKDQVFFKKLTNLSVTDYDLCMIYGRCLGLTVWQSKFMFMVNWWIQYQEPLNEFVYLNRDFYDCVLMKNESFSFNYSQFSKAKAFFIEKGWLVAGGVRGKYWINYDLFLSTGKVDLVVELRTK